MKYYLAGPMRGLFGFNFLGFQYWQRRLEEAGFEIISPADLDRDCGVAPDVYGKCSIEQFRECMNRDYKAIDQCGALLLMPGWQHSQGVELEIFHATTSGKKVYELSHDQFPNFHAL